MASTERVVILGRSNLGYSLYCIGILLGRENIEPHLLPGNAALFEIEAHSPTSVFNTAGGSIESDFDTLSRLNLARNEALARHFPRAKIIAFSSNAALEPETSSYAKIKTSLESLTHVHENLHAVRVCNLYGRHSPDRCFPHKLVSRNRKDHPVYLPSNVICPTPTNWLSEILLAKLLAGNLARVDQIRPRGETTVSDWGRAILGAEWDIRTIARDESRPSSLWISEYKEHWLDLWNQFSLKLPPMDERFYSSAGKSCSSETERGKQLELNLHGGFEPHPILRLSGLSRAARGE